VAVAAKMSEDRKRLHIRHISKLNMVHPEVYAKKEKHIKSICPRVTAVS